MHTHTEGETARAVPSAAPLPICLPGRSRHRLHTRTYEERSLIRGCRNSITLLPPRVFIKKEARIRSWSWDLNSGAVMRDEGSLIPRLNTCSPLFFLNYKHFPKTKMWEMLLHVISGSQSPVI